ncbi:OsmC family protein [Sphingomicrobium nitratireducens]|uniref:OsmC family protein n=1 Tax=Sphingomicrobium nitratireducens TaxID=2964666 RepID=UPI002240B16E|nr:OsmC family protein [Sphingomicrobium nitratireducens]
MFSPSLGLAATGEVRADRTNGINVAGFNRLVERIRSDTARAKLCFKVNTRWTGQTRSETVIDHYEIGGEKIDRRFKIVADEPRALMGQDSAPNPQELLMSALNSCILIGWVTSAALKGVTLETLFIETDAELDMRGFMGIDERVKPGCQSIHLTVTVAGDAPDEVLYAIHEGVLARSPNYFDLSTPIAVSGRLEILRHGIML